MSFYNLFKNFFGIPDRQEYPSTNRENDNPQDRRANEFRNPIWNLDDEDDDDEFRSHPSSPFGFRIFNDPLEIHRFFEQQMDEILKNFQLMDMPMFGTDMFPALPPPDIPKHGHKKGSLREEYLKPGYTLPKSGPSSGSKIPMDNDLDDRITAGELDKIFDGNPSLEPDNRRSLIPSVPGVRTKTFGQSIISKTIRLPDGTIEHHRTVRDNEGHEETTVTRQLGDQSYSVVKKINPNGEEESIENFFNLEEKDLEDFQKNWFGRRHPLNPETDKSPKPHNWFPFDRFF